jgi:hypothetical protein
MQHYLLLQRNLVYTAMTRGRRLVVLVGQRKALAIAVRNDRAAERFSCLYDRLVRSQIDASRRSHSSERVRFQFDKAKQKKESLAEYLAGELMFGLVLTNLKETE